MGENNNKNKKRALSISGSDNEDGDRLEDTPVSPIKLDFRGSPRSRKGSIATRGPAESSRA